MENRNGKSKITKGGIIILITLIDIYNFFLSDFFLMILYGLIIIIPIIGIIVVGYFQKKIWALRLFKIPFIKIIFVDAGKNITSKMCLIKDLKRYGRILLIENQYVLKPDLIFLNAGIPTLVYKKGNPTPINLLDIRESDIPSTELYDAISSKAVKDLMRYTLSQMDLIYLMISVISIVMSGVVLYYIYTVNANLNTISDYLKMLTDQISEVITRKGLG